MSDETTKTEQAARREASTVERLVIRDRRHVPEIINSVACSARLFQHVKIDNVDSLIFTTFGVDNDSGKNISSVNFSAGGIELLKELLDV